jgi:hypothetical protein
MMISPVAVRRVRIAPSAHSQVIPPGKKIVSQKSSLAVGGWLLAIPLSNVFGVFMMVLSIPRLAAEALVRLSGCLLRHHPREILGGLFSLQVLHTLRQKNLCLGVQAALLRLCDEFKPSLERRGNKHTDVGFLDLLWLRLHFHCGQNTAGVQHPSTDYFNYF